MGMPNWQICCWLKQTDYSVQLAQMVARKGALQLFLLSATFANFYRKKDIGGLNQFFSQFLLVQLFYTLSLSKLSEFLHFFFFVSPFVVWWHSIQLRVGWIIAKSRRRVHSFCFLFTSISSALFLDNTTKRKVIAKTLLRITPDFPSCCCSSNLAFQKM